MNARKLLGLAGVFACATLFALGAFAWANGVRLYVVRTGSMSPAVRAGDMVVDLPVTTTTTLRIGEIITFHPQPGTTETHRIYDLSAAGIVTKGDANRTPDVGEIQGDLVVGRASAIIPYGGYVAVFFQQPTGIAALVLFFIALRLTWDLTENVPPGPLPSQVPALPAVPGLRWPRDELPASIAPRGRQGPRP